MYDNHSSLLALILVALSCACGGPKTFGLAPGSANHVIDEAPDWLLDVPAVEDHLTASATATSRDFQTAISKARTQAQIDLTQQLGIRLSNLTRQFQQEAGFAFDSALLTQFSSATKAITNETLVGAHVVERRVVPERHVYRAFVLMRLPVGRANTLLMQKLHANEALYTRFRATEAYAQLDEELQRYAASESTQN